MVILIPSFPAIFVRWFRFSYYQVTFCQVVHRFSCIMSCKNRLLLTSYLLCIASSSLFIFIYYFSFFIYLIFSIPRSLVIVFTLNTPFIVLVVKSTHIFFYWNLYSLFFYFHFVHYFSPFKCNLVCYLQWTNC